jgi:hypothetical protein
MAIDQALRAVPPTLVAEREAAVEPAAPDIAADVATDAAGAELDEA